MKTDVFDWNDVPPVKDGLALELERWLASTGAVERRFPLQLALQVHDEALNSFTSDLCRDALAMAEARGAIKAMKRFAQIYSKAVAADA